jgi:serine/threonine protein kinase/WD40 repeat protein
MTESATDAGSRPDPRSSSDLLGLFLNEIGQARDREAVVARYAACYPALADQFRGLVEMENLLAGEHVPTDGEGDSASPAWLGPYHVRRLIGRGGMGEVFEAVEEPLNRHVAVKTLRRGQTTRPDLMDRFLRERKVLARLHHTNIVPIYAAGQEGNLLYFAMPYIQGAPLDRVVETARSRESSGSGHATPTLAELAEAARSTNHDSDETSSAPSSSEYVAAPKARAPEAAGDEVTLSTRYLRSVARAMADVAEALHHAHLLDVVHRDLKPSNLMIDVRGHCWVLDFGLASVKAALAENGAAQSDVKPPVTEPMSAIGLGTPPYMAPEQYQPDGSTSPRTDVWGLGVTLYELLTLRRAFESTQQIVDPVSSPTPPSAIVRDLPKDLEAICLKAIHKAPAHRYQSALELADELRRWLGDEPVKARPARAARRLMLWARRNKGWAAAIMAAGALLVALAVGGVLHGQAKDEAERNQRRETMISRLQQVRLTTHREGWWEKAMAQVRLAAEIRQDRELQGQAAATLIGVDATPRRTLKIPCTFLSFDPSGKSLYIVGEDLRTRIWDSATDLVQELEHNGNGIIAFRKDGSAVQLDRPGPGDVKNSVSLWDLKTNSMIRRLTISGESGAEVQAIAITPGGSYVAASAIRPEDKDGKGMLAVWEAESGRLVRSLPTTNATDLAVSPDGRLLAYGTRDGKVHLWPLPEGQEIATLPAGLAQVNCLAFGRDRYRIEGRDPRVGEWLLASGDNGGTVIVWDLHAKAPRSFCRGSHHGVFTLAFSPDGMTLASAGRSASKLWDIATGQLLLDLVPDRDVRAWIVTSSFSPNGSRLALGMLALGNGMIEVKDVDNARGISTLRGLRAIPEKTVFSTDGLLIAGISQDWRAGIWDTATGHLLHVFETPTGSFVDNAGLCIDPANRRFAAASGHEARMWDLATGEQLASWTFPEGFQDTLAFHGPNQLLHFRVETKDGKGRPYGREFPASLYPRVCRIRDLLSEKPTDPLKEVFDLNWHIHHTIVAPNGDYFVSEGLSGPKGERRIVMAFDGPTGSLLWSKESGLHRESGSQLRVDPSGKTIGVTLERAGRASLLSMPSGSLIRMLDEGAGNLGFNARSWQAIEPNIQGRAKPGFTVNRDSARSCSFGIDDEPLNNSIRFSPDDRHVSWGDASGNVYLADLVEVQRRLAAVGLGW